MMRTSITFFIFGAVSVTALFAAQPSAQTQNSQFVPFSQFIQSVKSADTAALSATPGVAAQDSSAIEEMRQSILSRYEGVAVKHSFVRDGMHFDCVPVEQQPAVRNYNLKTIATAPPLDLLKDDASAADQEGRIQAKLAVRPIDDFGNSAVCEANTVPLERITLDKMSRFSSLQEFYQKSPGELTARVRNADSAVPDANGHTYSVFGQNVNNLGGNTNINVWAPYVSNYYGQVFSLSQEWYVGGYGNNTQTEEAGWVVFPQMFGDENAHLFIYSTSGGYQPNTGCWNNSCGDFVQVDYSVGLGYSLLPISSYGGAQYAPSFRYYLYYGNWWFAYNGTWVGYYPGSKYHGGQNAYFAQSAQYGTETLASWYWPGAGSGYPADWGFGYSAYQRNVFYQGLDNFTYWTSLAPWDVSSCYSTAGPYYSSSSGWGIYFYDGGWGGTGCT